MLFDILLPSVLEKNLSQNKNNIVHKFKVLECYFGFKKINPMNASS